MKYFRLMAIYLSSFLFSAPIFGYDFQVSAKNKTSNTIIVNNIGVNGKGLLYLDDWCSPSEGSFHESIPPNGETRCNITDRKKRKRKITVHFICGNDTFDHIVHYPRNGGWYARNHLEKKGVYTVKIKDSDC